MTNNDTSARPARRSTANGSAQEVADLRRQVGNLRAKIEDHLEVCPAATIVETKR